uniref:Uncharacterized protein n=1 Tax=Candidatus Nitrotoga fabula TaxID=2182327 RepID=A0A2X0R594_9PROT|nr:conserved protein of unknown function [Candidatus Nitrotoga fabula]
MTFPIEPESRVSEALAEAMEEIINDPDLEGPVTLALVRDKLQEQLAMEGIEAERHEFGNEESLYAEIEALIDEFGEDAFAMDFTTVKASQELSSVIESILDDSEADIAPTLEAIREAMANGYLAQLVGSGVIETEDEESLMGELDSLIERYGPETLAEDVLGYE